MSAGRLVPESQFRQLPPHASLSKDESGWRNEVQSFVDPCLRAHRAGCLTGASAEWKAASRFQRALGEIAIEQTSEHVVYDGSYRNIAYPGGDVPRDRGVCSDVIVRAYRALGVDLQVLVHEDMTAHFSAYPKDWGLSHPDTNIDHRRVPNLVAFFTRHGETLRICPERLRLPAGGSRDLGGRRIAAAYRHCFR